MTFLQQLLALVRRREEHESPIPSRAERATTDDPERWPGWERGTPVDLTDQVSERYFSKDEHTPVEIVLPTPCVSYATYGLLSNLPELFWLPIETAPLRAVVDEFYERTILALRTVTEPDQFVYAVNTDYEQYRLWPHKAEPTRLWPPDMGDINNLFFRGAEPFFLAVDYSWGLCVSLDYLGCRKETVSIFGQPLIDAFKLHKPRLFGRALFIDGQYQAAPAR